MARIFILCGLLSMGLVCQGQLNYEGNPLTEAIEYTAQESQSPRLNARQRFEVADARTINLSKRPFTPSAIDPLAPEETKTLLSRKDDLAKYEGAPETRMREMIVTADKGSSLIATNDSVDTRVVSTIPSKLIEAPIEAAKPSVAMPQAETRQLRQYPMQSASAGTHQRSPLFQEVRPQTYHQTSRSYGTPEESPIAVNLSPQPQSPINQNSNEALSKFLNSRTPEESEMALQRFLTERERASTLGSAQQAEQSTEPRGISHDTFDNEIPSNYADNDRENLQNLPASTGLSSLPNQVTYLTRAPYQPQALYPAAAAKWSQNGPQSRRDNFYPGPPMKRHPAYRGPIRARVGPYPQPRITPGAPVYLHKGPAYSGPPPLAGNHPWKQPIEVIYTKPPGPSISNHPVPISNPPAAYEDASKWFPESDKLPPQKDVYYSQLYAQSYDPHYYNYIAKTGKVKPWLYGKLGKAEEKSIWWELYTGFKNHGMKNMMNPMFLLGMTIPTLTLMLSALIQKRSAARAYTGNYDPQEFLEVYEPQIRAAILAYERQMQENVPLDRKTEGLTSRRRRSAGPAGGQAPTKKLQEKWDNEKRTEKIGARTIGPAPPGFSPFEEYFLAHQEEFAQAFRDYDKKQREEYEKRKKLEQMQPRSIRLAHEAHVARTFKPPPGFHPFEEYFPAHQTDFPNAILAYEKELEQRYSEDEKTVQRPRRSSKPSSPTGSSQPENNFTNFLRKTVFRR